jgi:hypothetical protein
MPGAVPYQARHSETRRHSCVPDGAYGTVYNGLATFATASPAALPCRRWRRRTSRVEASRAYEPATADEKNEDWPKCPTAEGDWERLHAGAGGSSGRNSAISRKISWNICPAGGLAPVPGCGSSGRNSAISRKISWNICPAGGLAPAEWSRWNVSLRLAVAPWTLPGPIRCGR